MAKIAGEEKPLVYKPSEVAKLLRVDGRTIYAMIERGELPSIKAGRVIRIPAIAVESLMKGQPVEMK